MKLLFVTAIVISVVKAAFLSILIVKLVITISIVQLNCNCHFYNDCIQKLFVTATFMSILKLVCQGYFALCIKPTLNQSIKVFSGRAVFRLK